MRHVRNPILYVPFGNKNTYINLVTFIVNGTFRNTCRIEFIAEVKIVLYVNVICIYILLHVMWQLGDKNTQRYKHSKQESLEGH